MNAAARRKPIERRKTHEPRRRPITFLRRPLKPFLIGMMLTSLIIGQSNLRNMDRGTQPPFSYFVAGIALTATALLFLGWWRRNNQFVQYGFLMICLAYVSRAVFIMLASPFEQAVFFSLATAFMAGGAYLRESEEHPRGRRE